MNNIDIEQLLRSSNDRLNTVDFNELILRGLEKDIDLDYDDIYELQKKHNRFTSEEMAPRIISQFLNHVALEDIDVLVPWNIYGELITPIYNQVRSSVLINNNEASAEITEVLLKGEKHKIEKGDSLKALDKYQDRKFDLICSYSPLAYRVKANVNNENISDELNHLHILKSSKLLSKNGKMYFIVAEKFFNRNRKKSILPVLENTGIYLDAAFYLPPGTLINTGIGAYLVVLSHKKYNELFVSELRNENIDQAIQNWKKRRESKLLQNGKLVGYKSFTSYVKLEKELEIKRRVKKSNLQKTPLANLFMEINALPKGKATFEHYPNSIYLPNIGLSKAVDSPEEMKNKPQNYFQIILNNDVNTTYLTRWFNTELGITVRESLMSGGYIKKINRTNLMNANVYLPEKNVQQEIITIQSKIEEFKNELESIERKAWNFPDSYPNLNKKLEKLNREEGFVEWVETLPFPLASIIYKYHATKDISSKKEYLLHFFEAFSQFQVVLMLSAFEKNGSNLDEKYIYHIDTEKLAKATFGGWVHIGANLAKKIRQLLEDEPEQCLRLFQHRNSTFIKMISSKEIYKILEITKNYRNDWKGHGGVESDNEAKNRLILLEKELHGLRNVIGDIYEDYQLIQPGTGHFSSELYHCNCKLLKGTRNTFVEHEIEVLNGLNIESLYLLEKDGHEPLELLPFIKLMPSPNTQVNACYFYNRLEQDGVRMVSYYFDQDADVKIHDDSIQNIINNLNFNY